MSHLDLVQILGDEGLDPIDVRRSGAKGAFTPLGQAVHHTGNVHGAAYWPGNPTPTLGYIRDGAPAAPLSQVVWGYDARPRVITDGKANHAGKGSATVLARLMEGHAPDGPARVSAAHDNMADGNRWFIGHEIENAGDGDEPFTPEQWTNVARGCAAIARAAGWSEATTIAHFEWTDRKIDPIGWAMVDFRRLVGGLLLPAVQLPTVPQEDEMKPTLRFVRRDNGDERCYLAIGPPARPEDCYKERIYGGWGTLTRRADLAGLPAVADPLPADQVNAMRDLVDDDPSAS